MNTTSSDSGIQLFAKKGRRYVPWGNVNDWHHDDDLNSFLELVPYLMP